MEKKTVHSLLSSPLVRNIALFYTHMFFVYPLLQMKKNSGGRLHALLIGDYIGILLQHPKTSLTSLHLYLYQNATIEHVLVDSVKGKRYNIVNLSFPQNISLIIQCSPMLSWFLTLSHIQLIYSRWLWKHSDKNLKNLHKR